MLLTIRRNPVATALGLVAICFLILAIPSLAESGRFGHGHGIENAQQAVGQLGLETFLALFVLFTVLILGWAKPARLTTTPNWRGTVVLIPPLLYVGALLVAGSIGDGPGLGAALSLPLVQRLILFTLLVGVFEELLFRGVVLHAFEIRCGVIVAFFVSSLLFGLMHYVNWIGGQSFESTTLQVAHAAGSGLMYAAIVFATRSIWLSVAFHALWDSSIFLIKVIGTDPPIENAAGGDGHGIVQSFLLLGLEPIYGLVVFWWWYRLTKARGNA